MEKQDTTLHMKFNYNSVKEKDHRKTSKIMDDLYFLYTFLYFKNFQNIHKNMFL